MQYWLVIMTSIVLEGSVYNNLASRQPISLFHGQSSCLVECNNSNYALSGQTWAAHFLSLVLVKVLLVTKGMCWL